MIQPQLLYNTLTRVGIDYYIGVPDSLLGSFTAYVADYARSSHHVIAANEGGAVSLGIGYHLATGRLPLVYLQNSGLGNAINPLLSLASTDVYAVPMLLLVGWRGEPGLSDEPQHRTQGRVTLDLLSAVEIPVTILSGDETNLGALVSEAVSSARQRNSAHAIVAKKGTFANYASTSSTTLDYRCSRAQAIRTLVDALDQNDIVVAPIGMASRELFEYRQLQPLNCSDFLAVGGMGHASQIALAIAANKKRRRVICIDGDGAALMHLGAMAINGCSGLSNFRHLILNNGAHDSVGGQPTLGFDVDFAAIARACGYVSAERCIQEPQLQAALPAFLARDGTGPKALEMRIAKGCRSDLGRPTAAPEVLKKAFMDFLTDERIE